MVDANYKILEREIDHIRELVAQHNKLNQVAIDKAYETLNERLGKMNEFREQLKDMIATLARQKEVDSAIDTMSLRFEQNIKTVTDRYEENVRVFSEKINVATAHLSEKIEIMRSNNDDKRDTLYAGVLQMFKTLEDKITGNMKMESERFAAVDKQMQVTINANADVSNIGLTSLNKWREGTQGSIRVIMAIGSFIAAIVMALLIGFLNTIFK